MDNYFQPPDPPDEGNCRRCKRWISRDELLEDGCIECDDLLIEDLKRLWQGRPKRKVVRYQRYHFLLNGKIQSVELTPSRYFPMNWTGLLTPPYSGHKWKPEISNPCPSCGVNRAFLQCWCDHVGKGDSK